MAMHGAVIVSYRAQYCRRLAELAEQYHRICSGGSEHLALGDEETAREYLRLFCRKSDTAMQYVQKWMPIVAASQSVKGNAHEREFLLGWVDVVEYE